MITNQVPTMLHLARETTLQLIIKLTVAHLRTTATWLLMISQLRITGESEVTLPSHSTLAAPMRRIHC